MLSLPKHLARIARLLTSAVRARCFGKLSMTFLGFFEWRRAYAAFDSWWPGSTKYVLPAF
jgi:hypothetical protein